MIARRAHAPPPTSSHLRDESSEASGASGSMPPEPSAFLACLMSPGGTSAPTGCTLPRAAKPQSSSLAA